MESRCIEKTLIVLTAVAYIITLFFNQVSNGLFLKDWFIVIFDNRTTGSVANDAFPLQILPAGATFSIWGVIYTWQALWIIYTWTLFCRSNAAHVLGIPFYSSFIFSCLVNVFWLVAWAHLKDIIALVLLLSTAFSLYSALFFAYKNVYDSEGDLRKNHPKDLICLRVLVQNGLAFYATWTTIASMINFAVVLKYSADVSDTAASCTALSILLLILIAWFILQNFVIKHYVAYTFSTWPVVIIGLSGIIAKNWNPSQASSILSVVVLVVAVLFYITRIAISIKRFMNKRGTMIV